MSKQKSRSDIQERVLAMLAQGHTLTNTWEGGDSPYRPAGGYYGGWIHSNSTSLYVPYRTITSLLTKKLIVQAHCTSHTMHYGTKLVEKKEYIYRLAEEVKS